MKNLGKIGVKLLIDLIEYTVIGLAVFIFTYIFAGQLLRVTGDSMVPNFHNGEQIIAEKISLRFEEPKRGEVVIFKHPMSPEKLMIKRVIALPGETIKISSDNKVYINNQPLNEPYLETNTLTMPGKVLKEDEEFKVPQNSYILMGDNRSNSSDSREWGPITRNDMVGKGFLVYYPVQRMRFIQRD